VVFVDSLPPHVRVHLRVPIGRVLLPPGEYVVGRSPECEIVLASGRASRRHARIVVDEHGATVEDLGSANGVYVNGSHIGRERRALAQDDFVSIGDQSLELLIEPLSERASPPPRRLAAGTVPSPLPPHAVTNKAHGLDLLQGLAERALKAGYPERAERAVADWLRTTLETARSGKPSEPHLNEIALKLASQLAVALGSSRWVDYSLELLSASAQPMGAAIASELDTAIEIVGAAPARLDGFAAMLSLLPPSPEQRASLEHVERWRTTIHRR
jgi:ribosome-associated protein YbcJ (S4-like RNA binding protein)